MPRLSPLHWILLVFFLAFYGFTVFAVTRDYYLRHPAQDCRQAATTTAAPAATDDLPPVPDPITESDPAKLHHLGDQLFVKRRFAEAIRVYQRLLELDAQDWDAANDLGLALHYTGHTSEALEILQKATTQAPEQQRLWLTYGFINMQAGDLKQGREALIRARDLDASNDVGAEAQRMLGFLDSAASSQSGQ